MRRVRHVDSQDRGIQNSRHDFFVVAVSQSRARRAFDADELHRRPALSGTGFAPTEKLVALTCEDLRVLLGVTGQPVFQHCVLYPKAIPQYNVGYGRYRELMNEIESRAAGLFFAGHYRDGVSLGDSILSGVNIVERATNFIETTDKHG